MRPKRRTRSSRSPAAGSRRSPRAALCPVVRIITRASTASATGSKPTGWSSDGLVESLERTVEDQQDEWATWMLGVQWHPEETAASRSGPAVLVRRARPHRPAPRLTGRRRLARRAIPPVRTRGARSDVAVALRAGRRRTPHGARRPGAADRPRRLHVGAGVAGETDDRRPGVRRVDGAAIRLRGSARTARIRMDGRPVGRHARVLQQRWWPRPRRARARLRFGQPLGAAPPHLPGLAADPSGRRRGLRDPQTRVWPPLTLGMSTPTPTRRAPSSAGSRARRWRRE